MSQSLKKNHPHTPNTNTHTRAVTSPRLTHPHQSSEVVFFVKIKRQDVLFTHVRGTAPTGSGSSLSCSLLLTGFWAAAGCAGRRTSPSYTYCPRRARAGVTANSRGQLTTYCPRPAPRSAERRVVRTLSTPLAPGNGRATATAIIAATWRRQRRQSSTSQHINRDAPADIGG